MYKATLGRVVNEGRLHEATEVRYKLLPRFAAAIKNAFRVYGPLGAAAYVFDHFRVTWAERAENFDQRFGTLTEGQVYPWQLAQPDLTAATSERHPYEATPAWLVRRTLEALPIDPRDFVFVDLGAGKGRALMIASDFGFSKLVGIEISSAFCNAAATNMNRYYSAMGQPLPYTLRCMNAADYDFEEAPLVVFLFNPFGKKTLNAVLAKLEASLQRRPRAAYVIYLNPRFEKALHALALFPTYYSRRIVASTMAALRYLQLCVCARMTKPI